MSDLKLLKEAIKSLGRYSPNHVKVFCLLVDFAIDNKVFLPVKEIQEKIDFLISLYNKKLNSLSV